MSLLPFILSLAIFGLVVGAFARLALPGRDPFSILQTMGIGVAGTFTAGFLMSGLTGGRGPVPFIAALFFSVLLLYVIRRRRGGSLTDPGSPSRHH
ncbi:MAG: GlsB/YeaQ/YmgE family stress response membrane protein [Actinomycetota bacterium]|nr:GlsB/YeaQ/YmgE family stress response membrane protein [Actinomycetota bacterium]